MVASDGYCGTPQEPAYPSEGWQTVQDRRNKRNSVIQSKISKLVDQALREANFKENKANEVATPALFEEVPTRSQTTGNLKENEFVSETEPKKKRWRRLRTSWVPLSRLPSQEERALLDKDINTMSNWDFHRALAEFERNDQKLQEITNSMQDTVTSLKRQGDRAECYLRMQEKIQKKLFKEEVKRLPAHFHSAAEYVCTNHFTRATLTEDFKRRGTDIGKFQKRLRDLKIRNDKFISQSKTYLRSAKDYIDWWKISLTTKKPKPPRSEGSEPILHRGVKVQHRRISRETPKLSLRQLKLRKLDKYLSDEFDENECDNDGLGRAHAKEPDTYGVRFKPVNVPVPKKARRGKVKIRDPFHHLKYEYGVGLGRPDDGLGWPDEAWSRAYYEELEKLQEVDQLDKYYEHLDQHEFQYDRIARALMASVVGETHPETPFDEDRPAEPDPTARKESLLSRAKSRSYARSVIKEALNLINDMEEETSDVSSDLEAESESKPVQTPAAINEALAAFVRANYPEVLQTFTAGPVPAAIQQEAIRLLTPRANSNVTDNMSSATKLMLDSYSSLDETGQNQMWLAACQSANKELIKGIVELRKEQDNSGAKLAKLVKELLTHSEKAKIEQLKWHTQAQQRRTNFHHWISRIKDVCAMFKETSSIMPKETIIPFQDKKCVGNRALYQLILSKVDNHCRDLLRHCDEEGDTALELLFVKCANVTGVDTDHYHQILVGLRIFQDESATKFIGRFLVARTSAERAKNEYTNSKLVSYLITGISGHRNTSYQLLISIIREKIMSGEEILFADLERRFLAIDETSARDSSSNRRLTSANSARSDRKPKSNQAKRRARANAAKLQGNGERDLSKLKCFNCQDMGHYARDCPKPQRSRNNEASNPSGSSLRRGNSARSQAASSDGGTTSNADTVSGTSTTPATSTAAQPISRSASRVTWDARAHTAT